MAAAISARAIDEPYLRSSSCKAIQPVIYDCSAYPLRSASATDQLLAGKSSIAGWLLASPQPESGIGKRRPGANPREPQSVGGGSCGR
jgi:hypothetical protein